MSYYPGDSGLTITGVDPNPYMLPYLKDNAAQAGWLPERLDWVEGRAEALPLADGSVDAVVCTLVGWVCLLPACTLHPWQSMQLAYAQSREHFTLLALLQARS